CGDELRCMVRGLNQPERAQGARAPPPQPAPQVPVGDGEQRHRLHDLASLDDARRVAIRDERLDQHPGDRDPMSRGSAPELITGSVISLKRTMHERAVPPLEAAVQRLLDAELSALEDDGTGHRECGRDGGPEHDGREARKGGEQLGHRNPCTIDTVSRSSLVSFDRHWCSHVAATDVSDGIRIRSPGAMVVAPRFPIRSAVRSSKLSMPYAYVAVMSTRRQA